MKAIIFIYCSLLSFHCLGAGYVSIDGKTSDGWSVVFDEEPPATVWIWKDGADRESSVQSFKGQCRSTESGFECEVNEKSPLSGTKYERHSVGSCDVDSEYVCVEGCTKNLRAPRVMTQGYWEGDPDCGKTEEEILQGQMLETEMMMCWERAREYNKHVYYTRGWIWGDKVNLRESPDISGKILKELPKETLVRVVTDGGGQTCFAIGGKGGRWVKVEIVDGSPSDIGYVFDAHILYQDSPQMGKNNK